MGKGKRNRKRTGRKAPAGGAEAVLPSGLREHIAVDQATLNRMGIEGLQGIWANVWPIDCQSCGQALDPHLPASLYVADLLAFGSVTLHHPQCRAPQWSTAPSMVSAPFVTWRALAFMAPFTAPDDPDSPGRPMLLINPHLEQCFIKPCADDTWTAAPQDLWRRLGLRPAGQEFVVDKPVPRVSARVVRNSVSVRFEDYVDEWSCDIDRQVSDAVHELGGITVGVTNRLSLIEPTTYDQLGRLMQAGEVLMGWVALRGAEDRAPLGGSPAPSALSTYVLHWSAEHCTVGALLATTATELDDDQAVEWAHQHLPQAAINQDEGSGWQPVTADAASRYLLDTLSGGMYFLRRHSNGWQLVDTFARYDGQAPGGGTEPAVRAWGESVIRLRTGAIVLSWSPQPSTADGFTTLHAAAAEQ